MVITSTTGNRVVAKSGSRVRISPTPPKQKAHRKVCFFVLVEISGRDSKSCRNNPVDCYCRQHKCWRPHLSLFLRNNDANESLLLRQKQRHPFGCLLFLQKTGEIRIPVVICRWHITSPVHRLVISSIFACGRKCKRISPTPSNSPKLPPAPRPPPSPDAFPPGCIGNVFALWYDVGTQHIEEANYD